MYIQSKFELRSKLEKLVDFVREVEYYALKEGLTDCGRPPKEVRRASDMLARACRSSFPRRSFRKGDRPPGQPCSSVEITLALRAVSKRRSSSG